MNSTWGAQQAVELLQERVFVVRTLRGSNVVPLVNLSKRPMKTNFGVKFRPEFEIADWLGPGGPGGLLGGPSPSGPTTPQLSGPSSPPAADELGSVTAGMTKVTPPSVGEEIGDSIPF